MPHRLFPGRVPGQRVRGRRVIRIRPLALLEGPEGQLMAGAGDKTLSGKVVSHGLVHFFPYLFSFEIRLTRRRDQAE